MEEIASLQKFVIGLVFFFYFGLLFKTLHTGRQHCVISIWITKTNDKVFGCKICLQTALTLLIHVICMGPLEQSLSKRFLKSFCNLLTARWQLKGRTASHNICLTVSSKLWKHLTCFIHVINSGLCAQINTCFPSGVLLSRGYVALLFFLLDLLHLDLMYSGTA